MSEIGGDIFDSRDVEKRIDELEAEARECEVCGGEGVLPDETDEGGEPVDCALCDGLGTIYGPEDEEDREELKRLRELRDDVDGREWRSGITFISDNYFERYAEQMAEDIGAIDPDASWPLNHIDWESAADELKNDYSSVDLEGTLYWYRS